MSAPILNKVHYVSKLLPFLSHCIDVDMRELIAVNKRRAVHDLFEKYPTITFCEILFELKKASRAEVCEAVEDFKGKDGRYIYKGNFVSREFLENELSQIDAELYLTAWIKESEAKNES